MTPNTLGGSARIDSSYSPAVSIGNTKTGRDDYCKQEPKHKLDLLMII